MNKFFKGLPVILLSFFVLSCEIGLGSAVDTEAPTIEITYPQTNTVVRDSFLIKGNWNDDGAISSLLVTLHRPDEYIAPATYTATVEKSRDTGTWYAVIHPIEEGLIDGTYEATVTITDEGGHTITSNRTFIIDNTEPLIVLDRPSTEATSTKADAYGRTLTIEGTGLDDNVIDHIDFEIYDSLDSTVPLKTITKNSIPKSFNLEIAEFEEGVSNEYSDIYGSSSVDENSETQIRYLKIKAYDNAQKIPLEGEQTAEDLLGNCSEIYYLTSELYKVIPSGSTLLDLYNMVNGTYTYIDENRSAETSTTVLNNLATKTIESGKFSLNPLNNPYFFVSGREALPASVDLTEANYNITNGTRVVIEVSPGLDQIPLEYDERESTSLRPYLIPCNSNGTALLADTTENASQRIYLAQAQDAEPSGSTYKFTVDLKTAEIEGLATNRNYLVGVEGADQNGNVIIGKDGKYGFRLVSSGVQPTILSLSAEENDSADSAVGKYINGTTKNKFKNKLQIDCQNAPCTIYRVEGSYESVGSIPENLKVAINPGTNSSSFTYYDVITLEGTNLTNKTYTYYLVDAEGTSGVPRQIFCYVDQNAPEIPVITLPAVSTNGIAVSVSGSSALFRGSVNDASASASQTSSGITKLYYNITNSSATPSEWYSQYSSDGSWSLNASLRNGTGTNTLANDSDITLYEGHYFLHIKAEDAASNMSLPVYREFYVDQSAPVIQFTDSVGSVNPADNSFRNSNFTLKVSVSDDHGIPAGGVTLTYREPGQTSDTEKTLTQDTNDSSLYYIDFVTGSSNSSEENYLPDGTYSFIITAKDESEKKTNQYKTLTVDTQNPSFTTLTFDDTSIDPDADNSSAWYESQTLTLSIVASDNPNGSGLTSPEYAVLPSTAPAESRPADSAYIALTYDNTSSYTGNVSFSRGEGQRLFIRLKDKAGNTVYYNTNNAPIVVNIDPTAPDLSTLYYQVGEGTITSAGGTAYVNGTASVKIWGTYSDSESGVNTLTVKLGSTPITAAPQYSDTTLAESAINETSVSGLTYSAYDATKAKDYKFWKLEFTPASAGKIEVEGSNLSSKTASDSPFRITLDQTLPNIKNDRVMVDAENDIEAYSVTLTGETEKRWYINSTKNTSLTISGVSTDNVGVDTVSLVLKKNDGTEIKAKDDQNNDIDWPYSGDVSEWSFANINLSSVTPTTNSDTYDVLATIKVTDLAGNTRTSTYKIYFDNDEPLNDEGSNKVDALGKDLYFRIGNENNDDITESTASSYFYKNNDNTYSALAWDSDKDVNVGNKYSEGSYGNASTIHIKGNFIDDKYTKKGSGIAMIYYKVFDDDPTVDEINAVKALTDVSGSFAPLSAPYTKRVFYNVLSTGTDTFGGTQLYEVVEGSKVPVVKTGTVIENLQTVTKSVHKYYRDITTTFEADISGFNSIQNYLVIVAKDNVGNVGVKTTSVDGVDYQKCTINVDTVVPNITSTTTTQQTNGQQDVDVSVSVSDAASGVKSVTYYIDETVEYGTDSSHHFNYSYTLKDTDVTNNNWSHTIPASVFNVNGIDEANITVYAIAKDKAGEGNNKTISVCSVIIDKAGPVITIKEIDDTKEDSTGTKLPGKVVNKTISISGKASDTNGIRTDASGATTMKLYYAATANATEWTELGSIAHNSDWTFPAVDTTAIESTSTQKTVYLRVEGYDAAGNIGYSTPLSIVVNQDSDRPVIQFTDRLSLGTTMDASHPVLIGNSTLSGVVTDDDDVTKFEYQLTKKNGDTETVEDWTEAELTGSSFSIEIDDFTKKIDFRVTDSGSPSNPFTTSSTEAYSLVSPKITDKQTTPNTYGYTNSSKKATTLFVKVDITAPYYGNFKYTTDIAENGNLNENPTWKSKADLSNNIVGGPANPKIIFKIPVWDANWDDLTSTVTMTIPGITTPVAFTKTIETEAIPGDQEHVATYYQSAAITLYNKTTPASSLTSGTKTCSINVFDGARTEPVSLSFVVDNTVPSSITNVLPKITEIQSGVVNFRGSVSDNEGGSGIKYVKDSNDNVTAYGVEYYIPKSSETDEKASSISWQQPTTKGTTSWEIEFTNLGAVIGSYSSGTFTIKSDYEDYESEEDIYDIPVWFRLTDNAGNVGYVKDNKIRYNPNEDKPTVQITYPTHESGKEYVTMGGTITITGSANDDDGISAVYLQFDMDGNGTYENGSPFEAGDIVSIPNTSESGILADGTKSWYKTINISSLTGVNYTENSGKTLNIRAIAIESDPDHKANTSDYLKSSWSSVLHISVNNTIPQFSGTKLKRYSAALTDATIATAYADVEIDYTEEETVYINGNESYWYVCGTVQASENLNSVTISQSSLSPSPAIITKAIDEKNFIYAIPVSASTGVSDWSVIVYAEDKTYGNPQHNIKSIALQIDSAAPEFADKVGTDSEDTSLEIIKLYKNEYGSDSNELSSTNYVQNSNSWFTLAGRVTESVSGYSRLAFYFKRPGHTGDTSARVYNPMEERGTNNRANRTDITATPADGTKTSGNLYINDDGLPGLYISGATRSTENSITLNSDIIKNNKNIRTGGLIKIGGTYHLITDVSNRDTAGTISFTPNCSKSFDKAEFIYAMVVDHSGESLASDNSVKNDDEYADGMVESYTKSGANYTWDATIDSKNIPDGPIEIHCVVFDKAGNSRHGKITTKVSNNPPRITKVQLGTDLNADGKYALDKEFVSYYWYDNPDGSHDTSKGTAVWNLDAKVNQTTFWKAKKDVVVIPEFVGGTGSISYNYSKSTDTSAAGKLESAAVVSASDASTALTDFSTTTSSSKIIVSTASDTNAATLSADTSGNSIGALILENDETSDGPGKISTRTGEDSQNVYRFSFWDETEGCTKGVDSQWSVLNVTFAQDLADNIAPSGTITPFYWTSKTANSVQWSGSRALGHIDLSADLPSAFTDGATDKVMDRDAKVSGKIKIEGTASDETRLGSITVGFGSKSATATYSSSGWTDSTSNADYSLTVTDSTGPGQSGHNVTWTLLVDTSKVPADSKLAATDQSITVTVKDAANNNASGTPVQVDIVPYITKIWTSLSDSAGEEFARSATGKYVVRTNETVKLYGFNLKAGTNTAKIGTANVTPRTGGSDTTNGAYLNFPVGTKSSGAVSITVDGVTSLNNLNKNPTFTSDENDTITGVEYNSQANDVTNNRLTDDVELWVWDTSAFDDYMDTTDITSPMMKMDNSGNYYISYGNGTDLFAIEKNGETSVDFEKCYNKYHNTNVAFDTSGNFYGVATNTDRAGSDRKSSSSYTFFSRKKSYAIESVSDRIDVGDSCASYSYGHYVNGTNKRRLELSQYGDNAYNINRVQRPKMTVTGAGTTQNPAKVYMSYYDSSAKNVKFRYGTVTGEETQNYSTRTSKMTKGFAKDLEGTTEAGSSATGYHLIADSADSTTYRAGDYTAVGYTKDGYAVVAWYDAKARRIVYSYNKTPGTAITSMTNNTWQNNAIYLDGTYTGWYVDLVVDGNDGVHIAYYNSNSGDLKYVYIPKFDDVSINDDGELTGATVITVDSYLSVGTNITINVRNEGTGTGTNAKYVPYIYYYNSTNAFTTNSVKVAWQKETSLRDGSRATNEDGAKKDTYTGAWECMIVPSSQVPADAIVCGGVPTGTHTGGTDYSNTVVLSYMTDQRYEKAYIKGSIK